MIDICILFFHEKVMQEAHAFLSQITTSLKPLKVTNQCELQTWLDATLVYRFNGSNQRSYNS